VVSSISGVARIRHDGYAATGRPDPHPGGPVEQVRIAWTPGMLLRTGEVVMLTGTDPAGMIAERLGPVLNVSSAEQQTARDTVGEPGRGRKAEAVELLGGLVGSAAEQARESLPWVRGKNDVMEHQRFVLEEFEDGILVRDPSTPALVLVTPYISWGAGRAAGNRHGARRVLAVITQPTTGMAAWEAEDVRMMTSPSAHDVAKEILAAHHTLGSSGAH
jgi:hypothetical protein